MWSSSVPEMWLLVGHWRSDVYTFYNVNSFTFKLPSVASGYSMGPNKDWQWSHSWLQHFLTGTTDNLALAKLFR